MVDLILGDVTIGFGQLPHGNENGFQKDCLAQGILQWVHSARAIGAHPIKKCTTEKSDDGSDEPKKQITNDNTNELEQGNSRSLINVGLDYIV